MYRTRKTRETLKLLGCWGMDYEAYRLAKADVLRREGTHGWVFQTLREMDLSGSKALIEGFLDWGQIMNREEAIASVPATHRVLAPDEVIKEGDRAWYLGYDDSDLSPLEDHGGLATLWGWEVGEGFIGNTTELFVASRRVSLQNGGDDGYPENFDMVVIREVAPEEDQDTGDEADQYLLFDSGDHTYHHGEGTWGPRAGALRYLTKEDARAALDDVDCLRVMRHRLVVVIE